MTLAAPHPHYPKAEFLEPETCGFIYLGMSIDPPRRIPLVGRSSAREQALERITTVAGQLADHSDVVAAQVYRAVLIPPTHGGPRFDAAMLIRTTSPATITQVQASTAYHRLNPAFSMTARNIRRIGQTDSTRSATFLFNHFTAPDPDEGVDMWEQLTGWYTAKTGVDNATLLRPIDTDAAYSFVNYVRLPIGPIRFLANQFTRPSFYRYVRGHLRSNSVTAMPILFERV